MNRSVDRNANGRNGRFSAAAEIARGSVLSLYQHWAMALFSLVAAFAIWFVIQDVENPIVQANFPGDGSGIPVAPINVEDATPNETQDVEIQVEGREDDLEGLSLEDFEATVDLKGLPVNTPTEAPVRVRSLRDGVRVLSVNPSRIQLTLEPIEERSFPVTLNTSGQLNAGLEIRGTEVDPVQVTVRGLSASLQLVQSVDLDVNLAGLREGETPIEGELRARSLTGDTVEVTISPPRAAVTYTVAQNFVQRSLPVRAPLTGQLAPGFRIGNITIEPPVVSATGPRSQLDGRNELLTEAVNIGGATSEVRLVRNVELIDNVSFERRTVTVRIEVKAIECGTGNTACPAMSIQVAPGITNPPAGLFVQGGLTVTVKLAGPLAELQKLNPREITATVNLGAPAGNGLYPVSVTVPANLSALGVRAEQPDPIAVPLGPNP